MTDINTNTTNDTPVINATHHAAADDFEIALNARALKLLQMVLEEKHCEVIRLDDHRRGLQGSYPRPVLAREELPNGTVIERAVRGTTDEVAEAQPQESEEQEEETSENHTTGTTGNSPLLTV
jgi:hypothetical protein